MLNLLLLAALLAPHAHTFPLRSDDARLRGLLQAFVNTGWGGRFQALGDESDFDHGHVVLDAATGAPAAILYHTRELAEPAPPTRSWLQWLDGREPEDAGRYERTSYPRSAEWDWFVQRDLPRLRGRHTVVERMLDPERLGFVPEDGPQWTFSRVDCARAPKGRLRIALPDRSVVCLKTGLL